MEEFTWENVFNTSHKRYGFITIAQVTAETAAYPYFCWNDRVYSTSSGEDTGYIYDRQWNYFKKDVE